MSTSTPSRNPLRSFSKNATQDFITRLNDPLATVVSVTMASQYSHQTHNQALPILELEEYGGVIHDQSAWGNTVPITPQFRVTGLKRGTHLSTGLKTYATAGAMDIRVFLSTNYRPTHNNSGNIIIRATCYLHAPHAIILLIPKDFVDIPVTEYRDPTVIGAYNTAFIEHPTRLQYLMPSDYAGGILWGKLKLGTSLGVLKVEIGAMPRLKMTGPLEMA
ncbi:hypothetical protein B0H16DRAFT_1726397 [Mycena metata]|uniref:Uncharacterized protein n=1 Tax=Mycena metata TaxID=1033252 RepID=A0AAD7IQE7_9AGAR|nr:hypothetical protein B0H16DRAFT_1726397 [Mycena metata]